MSDSDSPLPGAGTNAGVNDQLEPNDSPAPIGNNDMDMDLSENEDNESDLSEVDEAEFADFDPTTVALDDRPAAIIDENIAKSLKAVRKTTSGEKKPKPAKREKKKKTRRNSNEGVEAANEIEGKRRTKGPRAEGGESQQKTKTRAPPVPLTEEDQKEFELDAIINAATKGSKRRKKQDDIDLEQAFDEEIAALKIRMEQACEADNTARERGEPAIHKLKMLPEVVSLLNRNTVQDSIVDPDTNFLQAVKFFLEPLSDGSLPAYNIQRDLFNALARLPIEKEALLSSGIGKVVLYYTKTKRPEIGIKRIAERLLGEWSRPILKRSDDYKKRKIEQVDYDPKYVSPTKQLLLYVCDYANHFPALVPLSIDLSPKLLQVHQLARTRDSSNVSKHLPHPSPPTELASRPPTTTSPLRPEPTSTPTAQSIPT